MQAQSQRIIELEVERESLLPPSRTSSGAQKVATVRAVHAHELSLATRHPITASELARAFNSGALGAPEQETRLDERIFFSCERKRVRIRKIILG